VGALEEKCADPDQDLPGSSRLGSWKKLCVPNEAATGDGLDGRGLSWIRAGRRGWVFVRRERERMRSEDCFSAQSSEAA
jgi:hypothetical protein